MIIQAYALSLVCALLIFCPSAFAFDNEHKLFTQELRKYVHSGCVDYTAWKKAPEPLNAYLDSLGEISAKEYDALSSADKKALWLNGYNAFTIKIVIEHYPVHGSIPYYPADSLRQIPDVWDVYHFKIAGRNVNLEEVEHNVIRRDFRDPRMHFAVVCAARGAAPLRSQAFTAADIDKVLEDAKDNYLSDAKNLVFDEESKVLRISRVFSWFPLDFAPADFFKSCIKPPSDSAVIVAYLIKSGPTIVSKKLAAVPDSSAVKVNYLDYDWSLNDCVKP